MNDLITKELSKFIFEADRFHAFGTAKLLEKSDKSRSIKYENGPWRMEDNFFGGEPFGGRQIIHYQDKPFWLCVYFGNVTSKEKDADLVYDFLRFALQHATEDQPLRGPDVFKSHQQSSMEYQKEVKGDIEGFELKEKILESGKVVYNASFMGGLVDQRLQGSY